MKMNQILRRASKRLIFKLVIWIAAVLGITWQLDMVFETYFNYQTVTDTVNTMPEPIDVPSLMICTSYADVLDYDKLLEEKNMDRTNFTRNGFYFAVFEALTIKEIFDLTPDHIFDSCSIRTNSTRRFSDTDCSGFQHMKFFTQEYICYKTRPPQKRLKFYSYTDSLEQSGTMYVIGINESISRKMLTVLPVLSSGEEEISTSPFTSRRFSKMHFMDKNKSEGFFFVITYVRHNSKNLGYPYDNFICGTTEDSDNCFEDCVIKQSQKRKTKLPPEIETSNKYDMKIASWYEILDHNISLQLDKLVDDCYASCRIFDCNFNYSETGYFTKKKSGEKIWIYVKTPSSFYTYTTFVPKITVMDLFLYLVSFTGAWFGFAFVDIGSIKLRNIFLDKSSESQLNHLPSYRNRKINNPRLADLHMQHYASLFRPPR